MNQFQLKNQSALVFCFYLLLLVGGHPAVAGELQIELTDLSGAPLENAVVYLEAPKSVSAVPAAPAAIEQKQRRFIPLVSVAQVGASVSFPNNDTVRHHVYSFSPAKTFELKLYSGVPSKPVIFDQAGTVVLGCNIHDQMLAYVHVVDTPYFAKTDSRGHAVLKDIPNGQHKLKVWHYGTKKENFILEQTVKVSGTEQVTLKLDAKSN